LRERIPLTGRQLEAIIQAAEPLPPKRRGDFLEAVAAALNPLPLIKKAAT